MRSPSCSPQPLIHVAVWRFLGTAGCHSTTTYKPIWRAGSHTAGLGLEIKKKEGNCEKKWTVTSVIFAEPPDRMPRSGVWKTGKD
ncbi:hypothetical protein RRG08_054745 [Elysia crispata]|uniref:Uncharacterized protein n=1 Tax=Elysia crispata TaxID=231223 RepID=A0AAE1E9D7_9GAST|nr:hypothetical protein RRG08_054745 [Elysia crispata]